MIEFLNFYLIPALTLGAGTGYQTSSFSQLLTVPNRFWSIGPASALTSRSTRRSPCRRG